MKLFSNSNLLNKKCRAYIVTVLILLFGLWNTDVDSRAVSADYSGIAKSTQNDPVLREGMEPIRADELRDGCYGIDVLSSSSFFRIPAARLTVTGQTMTAELTMNSGAYLCLFPGTAEQAAAAKEESYFFVQDNGEEYLVTIPVNELSSKIYCAAFSKKKKKWYDRQLVFDASSLPEEAFEGVRPDYGELIDEEVKIDFGADPDEKDGNVKRADCEKTAEIALPNGDYSIEVTLVGGSGRASVSSPTWFYVQDGRAYAKLLWSSPYYDYLIVDGVKYLNETTDGSNSTFTIPVSAFDEPMEVIADTTAMGDPVEISYLLTFYSDTVGNKGQVPQEASKRVLMIALGIIIIGGVLDYFLKRRYRE